MIELLEILREWLEHGFKLVTLITALHMLLAWYEARRKRQRYEVMEAKIDALMKERGIEWTGQQNEYQKALRSLKQQLALSSGLISPGAFQLKRRVKGMGKISKAWLVGLLGYIAYFVKEFAGIELSDELINSVADLILLVMVLIPMFANMTKKSGQEKKDGVDDESERDRMAYGDHGPMV